MTETQSSLYLMALLVIVTSSVVQAENPPQTIANAMPGTDIRSTSTTVIDGLFEVVAGDNVLYVDTTGRYLVIGSIYDLQEDKDLSAERRSEVSKASRLAVETSIVSTSITPSVQSLPLTSAITTGSGERSLTIITDPQCGWCRRLWLESLSRLEGITVNHLLLNTSAQSVGILCAPDPGKALGLAFEIGATTAKTPVPSARCRRQATMKIARVVEFAEHLRLLGTPILIRDDGEVHAGYLGRTALMDWLEGVSDAT